MTPGIVLAVSAVLFGVGTLGVILRRSILTIALAIQLQFAASLIVFVGFDRRLPVIATEPFLDGAVFALVTIVAMGAELVLALVLALSLLRYRGGLDVERANEMRG